MRSCARPRKCLLQELVANVGLIHDIAYVLEDWDKTERIAFIQPVRLIPEIDKHRLVPTYNTKQPSQIRYKVMYHAPLMHR